MVFVLRVDPAGPPNCSAVSIPGGKAIVAILSKILERNGGNKVHFKMGTTRRIG